MAEPPRHGQGLPNAQSAIIPPEKLRDYALNPDHERGRHKARLFAAMLGYRRDDWVALRDAIVAALPASPARRVSQTRGGVLYEVVIPLTGPNGDTADVVTAWRLPNPADPASVPRLVTVYPKR